MYYTYFIKSVKYDFHYIGHTNDLKLSLAHHNSAKSKSTKYYAPFELASYVAVKTRKQASDLEKYFKTGSGAPFARKGILRYEAAGR
ncbi:MAG: GIY-YIG nuclease family protein [Candidatus Marinimicrobia bacterium]|nr:GIY-YIG nuclease family protein [Candidatus Neomarinimicrobiota bacterium]